jgi:class 3 adenylate cyclase
MSASPDSTSADLEQTIVDLRRGLTQLTAERDQLLAERDEAFRRLDDAHARETATAEVLGIINASPGDLASVFDAILEKAHSLCGIARGSLELYDGERFRAVAVRGMSETFADLLRQGLPAFDNPATRPLIEGERFGYIADMAKSDYSIHRTAAETGGVRTLLCVPLRREGQLLGMIASARREVRPFSEKETALLESFAAQAVIAMDNARLLTDQREALEQQTATAEVLQVINSSPGNLAPVFDAMLEKAVRLCDFAFAVLWIFDGEMFRAQASHAAPSAYATFLAERPAPVTPGTAFARLLAGEDTAHFDDVAADEPGTPYGPKHPLVALGRARTYLAVALRKEGRLLGAISAFRQEVNPFTAKQIALLQNFAAQAVIAMESARLLTDQREALEQQTATAEVLQIINSSQGDLVPVFDGILQRAIRLCEAAFGNLWLYDGESFNLVAAQGPFPPSYLEMLSQAGQHAGPHTAMRRAVLSQQTILIADYQLEQAYLNRDPVAVATAEVGKARTILAVPMVGEAHALGVFFVYRQEVRSFSKRQIALLQNFAAQAVIAMENARLLGELRERTDQVAELNRGLEARVAEQVEELGRVGRLKRFLAPQLAELIVSQGDEKILESHRREIVVVFCDLRGYTAFAETAEPEEVLDFLREYHGALGPLVSQFEGTLDQFSGDGIMVFFNDPVPIPDPAERAVKMAVAMREAASSLIAAWRERGRELGFGVGLAQGYATLGQIGFSERFGYTAIGTVCNVAARLCGDAKDGQILLSQRVNVALKGSVATEQLGALVLKGLTQPVVAYNVPLAAGQPALRVIDGGNH